MELFLVPICTGPFQDVGEATVRSVEVFYEVEVFPAL